MGKKMKGGRRTILPHINMKAADLSIPWLSAPSFQYICAVGRNDAIERI
jgi:hypothetical protein